MICRFLPQRGAPWANAHNIDPGSGLHLAIETGIEGYIWRMLKIEDESACASKTTFKARVSAYSETPCTVEVSLDDSGV